jgi:peroxiredoxin
MRIAILLLTAAVYGQGEKLDKYKQGHSHVGDGLNEGPRQKPWDFVGAGRANFPITHTNPETQKWFNQGIALLHSFWYYEAERSFRWCLKLEPENAMAWWGMHLAAQGDRSKDFLKEAVKRKSGVSERERLYIEAAEVALLPAVGEKADRRKARETMERLVMKYPDDIEAKAFLALNIMDNRVGAELLIQQVLAKEPDHPGAHHYRIHTWDGRDPEYALESCRRYGDIVFGIGHALHMPGHVYASAGMWHEAAISMDAATRSEKKYMQDRQILPFDVWNYPHNKNYLSYIQMQLGMEKAAIGNGKQLLQAPRLVKVRNQNSPFPVYFQGQIILARTYARFERWNDILKSAQFDWDAKFLGNKLQQNHIEALAHIGLGNVEKARKSLADLEALKGDVEKGKDFWLTAWHPAMVHEVTGKLLLKTGKTLEGLAELSEAAKRFGKFSEQQNDPPFYPTNPYDDLGRAYLEAKSPTLAIAAFERSLEIVRSNGWALQGLAEAHRGTPKAAEYLARLAHVWSDADNKPSFDGLTPKDLSPGKQRNYLRTSLERYGPDVWQPFAAPKLSATDPQGKTVTLEDYKGRNVVLIFYLGQECAHCMEQLQTASKRNADFEKHNAVVLAISPNKSADNADSQKLKEMKPKLLSDERWENAKRFLSYDDFENLEIHSTIFIDAKGRIRWVHRGGDPFTDFDGLFKEIERVNRAVD